MLTISDIDKAFGARDLFKGAELQVGARDRVAVVGPNGAGKTTLFDMIAGEQAPDSGQIRLARDAVVGYLHQETDDLRGRSLIDEVLSVGSEVTAAGHRLALLESEMTELAPGDERDRLVAEYGRLQHRFETLGGYTLEAEAKRILGGLGFKESDHAKPTDSFSGGWLMRIALSKLLLASPDLLMLDEPTNHLDVESVEWLERFLRNYEGSVLLISHDRDFMNGLATKVVEIDRSKLTAYTGNYQSFVAQREEAAMQAEALGKHQARQIAQTEAFINRFRYKASKARQVQSRIKALEKLDRVESLKSTRKTMNLRFPEPPRSGRVVIELEQIDFAYGEKTSAGRLDGTPSKAVYNGLEFVMEREHKVALVGPNGAGKTTLLKLLAGVLEPSSGERRLGHNVNLGYFAQHQIEALEPKNRVLQELEKAMPRNANLRPRNLLGRFLFSGDDVDKPVSVLSGGERTRLALAKLLVAPFNVLCLDEPTNHLDIWSRDALEDALVEYAGAMVLITHDRHLIRQVANRIVEVVDGTLTIYDGDYDFYLSKRAPLEDDERAPAPVQTTTSDDRLAPKERRRIAAEERAKTSGARDRLRKIEREMDKVATEMNRIEKVFADPEFYSSEADVALLTQSYERAKSRSKKLEAEWEETAGLLDRTD